MASITVSQPRLPRSPATTVGTRGGYSDRTFSTGWSAVVSAPRRTCSTALRAFLRLSWGLAARSSAIASTSSPRAKAAAAAGGTSNPTRPGRSEEHTSELQSLMRISSAVLCLNIKHHIPYLYHTQHHYKY